MKGESLDAKIKRHEAPAEVEHGGGCAGGRVESPDLSHRVVGICARCAGGNARGVIEDVRRIARGLRDKRRLIENASDSLKVVVGLDETRHHQDDSERCDGQYVKSKSG